MPNNFDNSKRIAKNTMMLYLRMFFTMAVTLYTSRVVLRTLGVTDFGIYNVVGGVVSLFSFINSAMSTSSQRFMTFEIGKNDMIGLKKVFATSLFIHFLIAIFIFILGETIGLWFLYNKMIIPDNRMDSALWVFQCSMLSMMVMIVSVPYNALIISREKMSAFAYISIIEVSIKLLIVYLLIISDFDKLKLYSVLMLIAQLIIRLIYGFYCKNKFIETKRSLFFDKKLFNQMLGFASWNVLGNCAGLLFTEGLNILLNMFFGPVVNAARGVVVQVQGAIGQFSNNFQMAINPQITKAYANEDMNYMYKLIFSSSRITFMLLFILSFPVIIESHFILKLWLGIIPDHTETFLYIILATTIIDAMAQPIMQAAAATGHVRFYQSVLSGILLTIVPISYLILKLGGKPESVFVVHLCVCCIAFIVRLFIIRSMIQLPIYSFLKKVVLRSLCILLLSLPLPILIKRFLPNTFVSAIVVCFTCVIVVVGLCHFIGLDREERSFVKNKVMHAFSRIQN